MDGKTLVNVAKCVITNEKTNQSFDIGDTASEIDVDPILSAGKRDILRVKNRILGINQTEDICIGYTLKLTDNTFNLDVMQLVDGGTMSSGGYTSIPAGTVVDKDLFTLEIYTEEKDYSRTTGYTKFTFNHCKGKVPKWKMKDGDFIVPEFTAESIPFRDEKAVSIDSVGSLPGTTPTTPTEMAGVVGGTVTGNNTELDVSITTNIKWTFINAINQDDVDITHFSVVNKSTGTAIEGNVTIDTTKKIVTFIPTSIASGVTYTATASAVRLLDGSGSTTALSVDFTTI